MKTHLYLYPSDYQASYKMLHEKFYSDMQDRYFSEEFDDASYLQNANRSARLAVSLRRDVPQKVRPISSPVNRTEVFNKIQTDFASILNADRSQVCLIRNTADALLFPLQLVFGPSRQLFPLFSHNRYQQFVAAVFDGYRTGYISRDHPGLTHPLLDSMAEKANSEQLNFVSGKIDYFASVDLKRLQRQQTNIGMADFCILTQVSQTGIAVDLFQSCRQLLTLNPKLKIFIDGAQAFLNVNRLDIKALFKEFPKAIYYVFSTQKGLGGRPGGGFGCEDLPDLMKKNLGNQKHWPSLYYQMPNGKIIDTDNPLDLSIWSGTLEAVNRCKDLGLRGNNIYGISKPRHELRRAYIKALRELSKKKGITIPILNTRFSTPFILCFLFPCPYEVTLRFLEKHIFVATLPNDPKDLDESQFASLRLSFQPWINTIEEIPRVISVLEEIIDDKQKENPNFISDWNKSNPHFTLAA